jgi:hypothetical protein
MVQMRIRRPLRYYRQIDLTSDQANRQPLVLPATLLGCLWETLTTKIRIVGPHLPTYRTDLLPADVPSLVEA